MRKSQELDSPGDFGGARHQLLAVRSVSNKYQPKFRSHLRFQLSISIYKIEYSLFLHQAPNVKKVSIGEMAAGLHLSLVLASRFGQFRKQQVVDRVGGRRDSLLFDSKFLQVVQRRYSRHNKCCAEAQEVRLY